MSSLVVDRIAPLVRRLGVPLLLAFAWAGCASDGPGQHHARDADADADADAEPEPGDTAPDTSPDTATAPDTGVDQDLADAEPEGLGPPYPIVLAHGMAGFEHLADLEFVPYWHAIPERLASVGELDVFVNEVDPLNTTWVRGPQLQAHVERIVEETGYAKVILIGHSQGGLDARYVAHHRPDLVAAVVTVATPHRGTPVSDVILGIVPDERVHDLADAIVNFFGAPLYDELGEESSLMAPVRQFSEKEAAAFNAQITDQSGVAYFSVTGRSGDAPSDEHCYVVDSPEFVDQWWETNDPIDPLLWMSESIIGGALDGEPSDGLVPVESGKWGRFLGCIPADHMDEVGQLLGDSPGSEWNHLDFYQDLVAFLRTEGF